jgi:hypothetical protein
MLTLGNRIDISSYHELEVCTVADKKKVGQVILRKLAKIELNKPGLFLTKFICYEVTGKPLPVAEIFRSFFGPG